MKKLGNIHAFRPSLPWLALTPQAWPKVHSEAHFEALKLILCLTLWLSVAHSGSLWPTRSLSGSLRLTLWLSLAPLWHALTRSVLIHSGSFWLIQAHSGSFGPIQVHSFTHSHTHARMHSLEKL